MSYNGSGTFQINSAGQPVVAGTVITAAAFNALTADLATGLSTAMTKDGQTTATANIPMGNNKFTGVAAGTAGTDSVNLAQVQGNVASLVSVSGIDTITGSMSPTLTAYSTGAMYWFVASGTNTGAVTMNIDALGAKAVTRDGSTALIAGDIVSGQVAVIVYDGTRFQLQKANAFGTLTATTINTTNLTATGTVNLTGATVSNGGSVTTIDINGGTIDGAVIGGASAAAGTFTTATVGAGTVGAPSLTTTGDTNTGIWFPAADTLAASTGGAERMRIDSSGNVGIGTSSPTAAVPLTILSNSGNAIAQNIRGRSDGIGVLLFSDNSDVENGRLDFRTNQALITVARNAPLIFNTNSTERMRIDSSGNVGIGTSSPATKLDVAGGAFRINNGNSFQIYGSSGGSNQKFWDTYSDNTSGNSLYFRTLNDAYSSSNTWLTVERSGFQPTEIVFYTGSSSERMRITSTGNVRVGTAALATTATDGFLYIPTCAGTPTGVPTAITGLAPLVINSTNNKLYFYSGGAWRDAGP